MSSIIPSFDIKTIAMKEKIYNILIIDITLLSYKGDHIICESFPLILKKDEERISYEQYDCEFLIGKIKSEFYDIQINFKFSNEMSFYCLDKIILVVDKKFIEKIFKK